MHAGFVPSEAPGADSYFTPSGSVDAGNASLNKQRSAQRCSVINALDSALVAQPLRHRNSSLKLHKACGHPVQDLPWPHSALLLKFVTRTLCWQRTAAEIATRLLLKTSSHLRHPTRACLLQRALMLSCVQPTSDAAASLMHPDRPAGPARPLHFCQQPAGVRLTGQCLVQAVSFNQPVYEYPENGGLDAAAALMADKGDSEVRTWLCPCFGLEPVATPAWALLASSRAKILQRVFIPVSQVSCCAYCALHAA